MKKIIPWLIVIAAFIVVFRPYRIGRDVLPSRLIQSHKHLNSLCMGLDLYESDMKQYPASLDSLWTGDGGTNWNGPYIKNTNTFFDEWTNRFRYRFKEDGYEVRSAGPDGVFETKDDIIN